MRRFGRKRAASVRLVAIAMVLGASVVACASSRVSRQAYTGPPVERPDRILVYDFGVRAGDVPEWSAAAAALAEVSPPDGEPLDEGRKLGSLMAQVLVSDIRAMGLVAVHAPGQPGPRLGDLAIVGYFTAIDEGSAAERVAIGMGKGEATVNVHVDGYLATEAGMRRLGGGDVGSGGGKSPGLAVPLAVTIATANPVGLVVGAATKAGGEISGKTTVEGVARRTAETIAKELRPKFAEQGWISGN